MPGRRFRLSVSGGRLCPRGAPALDGKAIEVEPRKLVEHPAQGRTVAFGVTVVSSQGREAAVKVTGSDKHVLPSGVREGAGDQRGSPWVATRSATALATIIVGMPWIGITS